MSSSVGNAFARDPRTVLGEWVFERVVSDRLADEVIEVGGNVTFTEERPVDSAGRIRWAEQGVMRRRGAEIPVTRTLFLVERAGEWHVTFEDGRDFHPWSPGAEVVHLCGADTYAGLVEPDPRHEGRWQVTWQVSGPRKDYTMVTRLRREAAHP